jgi:outer membrane protein
MKMFVRTTLALLGLWLTAHSVLQAQQLSIVYIDSERLRREAPSLQTASQQLRQRMAILQAQADSAMAPLQQQLQQMQREYQQQQGMMTAETRQTQQQAIQAKQTELQQEGQQWQQRADQLQNDVLGPALAQINTVIDQLREERSYAFILDAASGGVVAADPARDLTDEVLRRLQAQANPGS